MLQKKPFIVEFPQKVMENETFSVVIRYPHSKINRILYNFSGTLMISIPITLLSQQILKMKNIHGSPFPSKAFYFLKDTDFSKS